MTSQYYCHYSHNSRYRYRYISDITVVIVIIVAPLVRRLAARGQADDDVALRDVAVVDHLGDTYIYIYTHMYIYIYIYVCVYIYIYTYTPRGFQGHGLTYTVKGPQFEETKTHIFLNRTFLEESQNES